jgi:hypothetical protein
MCRNQVRLFAVITTEIYHPMELDLRNYSGPGGMFCGVSSIRGNMLGYCGFAVEGWRPSMRRPR